MQETVSGKNKDKNNEVSEVVIILTLRHGHVASLLTPCVQGLASLARERPKDPIEYLAGYLLRHKREFDSEHGS